MNRRINEKIRFLNADEVLQATNSFQSKVDIFIVENGGAHDQFEYFT